MKRLILILLLTGAGLAAHAEKKNAAADAAFAKLAQADTEALLQTPKDVLRSARNAHGETLLIKAVVDGKTEAAAALLRAGAADAGARDKAGNDALLYAVGAGETALVEALLKAGAPTDRVYGADRENLAFEAARNGETALLERLLQANPALAAGVDRRGRGLIEAANAAAQSETALAAARFEGARGALTRERRAALLKDLARQKKNPRAAELRALLEAAK